MRQFENSPNTLPVANQKVFRPTFVAAFASFQEPGRIGDALPHYGLADAVPAPFTAKTSA
jgi:hypothetical protein